MRFTEDKYCNFLGNLPSVKAVQEVDDKELAEVGGSYEEIADRIQRFVDFVKKKKEKGAFVPDEEWTKVIQPVISKYLGKYGTLREGSEAWGLYKKEWIKLRAEFSQTWFDDTIAVLNYVTARGVGCPFGCGFGWNESVDVYNRKTGKSLTVCSGSAHMARKHHLLNKGHEYSINVHEFYEHFMPKDRMKK